MFVVGKEGRGILHVSQAYLKRPKQSTGMKGQGAELKEKGGALSQSHGGPGNRAWVQGWARREGEDLGRRP